MQRGADQSIVALKTPQWIGASKTPVASPLRAGLTGPEPKLKYLRAQLLLLAGLTAALFALVGAPDALAQATAPEFVYFQGRLTDENGIPANGATYSFELRFYSIDDTVDPPNGDCFLVDTHNNVTVTNGVYVLDVGGGTLSAPGDGGAEYTTLASMFQNQSTVWLHVKVSDGIVAPENLYPRTRMVSSAYAQNAHMVDGKHYVSAVPTPTATVAGDLWYDTTNNRFKYWNGTGWQTVGTSSERWSDATAPDRIYPTDAGDYGSTGLRIGDTGDLSMNGNLTADGTINTASSYYISGTRVLKMPVGTTNICVGAEAGDNLSVNADNTFVGYRAGNSSTTGPGNTFVGREAGFANQTGDGNTLIGYQAGLASINQYNTMVGYGAGVATDSGGANAFLGWQTALVNTSGERNTMLGTEAGNASTIGNRNTFVGFRAGNANVDGSDNVCIGCGANFGAGNLTNATAIGYFAQVDQSNSLVLGGTGVNVGIGTTAPSNRLDVRTDDGTTNATTNLLRLVHNTTGAPAAGLGTGILFTGESSTTEGRDMAQIDSAWSTVADATRSAAIRFLTVNSAGALGERMRLQPDGTLTIGLTNDNPAALVAYTTNDGGYGAYCENANSAVGSDAYGVKGMATGAGGGTHYAIMGEASGAAMSNYGLHGTGISAGTSTAYGIYATASGPGTNWAGYFVGNTCIGAGGNLVLYDSDSTNSISIRTPVTGSLTTNYTLILPADDGTANQLLLTDGSGNLTWSTIGASSIADDSLDYDKFQDTMDLDANLTLNQTTFTWGQNYTGTGAAGFTYTASGAVTAGNAAFDLNVSNAGTSVPAMMITNAGTGFALRVNDDGTTTDFTPFVVSADGTVCIGTAVDQSAGLWATTATSGERAVYGGNTSAGIANQYGVYGECTGATGAGTKYAVYGTASDTAANNYGVFGSAGGGTNNRAVVGLQGPAAPTVAISGGLYGETSTSTGVGVYGLNTAAVAAAQYGVYGSKTGATATGTGYGVYGTATGSGNDNYGAFATASGATRNRGVVGLGGLAAPTQNISGGVYAETNISTGYGVYGLNTAAVAAAQYGVYGSKTGATATGTGYGVYGTSTGTANDNYGVFATASGATRNRGVVGLGGSAAPTQNVSGGVYAETNISTGYGVYALNNSAGAANQYGVFGAKSGATVTGTGYGIYGTASGTATTNYGVYGTASGGTTNWAGYFENASLGLSASNYINWGAIAGTTGYGFRDNAGTIEYKNSGGGWASLNSLAGIGGSGTTNRIAKFTAATSVGDSNISDDGTDITADLGAIANSDIYFRADETVELQSDNNDVILDAGGDIDISAGTSGSYARITTQGAGDDIILDPYFNAVGSAAVRSTTTALDDLGTSTIGWRNLYLTNGIYNTNNDMIVDPKNAASGAVRPAVDDADDLGTLSFRWRDILIGGCLYGFETNDLVMDAGGTSTNGAVRPYVTDQDDLGSTTYRWRDLFLSGDVQNSTGNRKYLYRNAADTTSATNSGAYLLTFTNTGTGAGTAGISSTVSSLTAGDGIAIQGTASSSMSAVGTRYNYGVRGEAAGNITGGGGGTFLNNAGVYGRATGSLATPGEGVTAYGVWGSAAATEAADGAYLTNYGVYGSATNTTGVGSTANNAYGLYGTVSGAGTANYGIYATASGATTNWAGYFVGNTAIASGNNLMLWDSDNTNSISIRTPVTGSLTANYALVLPVDDGAANQLLLTDGSGSLSWTSIDGAFAVDSLDFTEFEDTMDLDANLTLNQTTYTWGQTYTGTGAAGFTYTASGAITAGNAALELNVSNAATTIPAMLITNAGTSYALRVNDVAADTTPFVITADGTVCIGTATDQAAGLWATTATSGERGVYGENTAAVAAAQYGVYGSKSGATVTGTGYGVYGTATGTANDNYGLFGTATGGTRNRGVVGMQGPAAPTQNVSAALYGETSTSTAYGVYGLNTAAVAAAQYGVYGSKTGATVTGTGYGVYGTATGTATTNYGVYGAASGGTTNWAGYFVGNTAIASGNNLVLWDSDNTNSISIRTPVTGSLTANYSLVLPVDDGTANQLLLTDGAGVLSWSTIGAASIADDSLDYAKFEDTMDLDANLTLNQTTYTWSQTFTGAADAFSLSSSSTAASSKTLSVSQTGATVGTDYAIYANNTGAATTNVGLYGTASGATTNWAGYLDGNTKVINNATTTGTVLDISDSGLTSGQGIKMQGPTGVATMTGRLIWASGDFGDSGSLLEASGAFRASTGYGYGLYVAVTNAAASGEPDVRGLYSYISDATTTGADNVAVYGYSNDTGASTTGSEDNYGGYFRCNQSGLATVGCTNRGVYAYGYGRSSTTASTYGVYAQGVGTADGTSAAYGIWATASGADTNWAGYFDVNGVCINGASPLLVFDDTSVDSGDRPGIQFKDNALVYVSGDDHADQVFGFYSTFSTARTFDAAIQLHGNVAASWGTYLELKHDGTDGLISTDVGDIGLLPASNVGIGTASPSYKLHVDNSSTARSLYAVNTRDASSNYGVYAESTATQDYQYGVYGRAYINSASNYYAYGVYGAADANDSAGTAADAWGGYFVANGDDRAFGVYASATADTNNSYGVQAYAYGSGATARKAGVYGFSSDSGTNAENAGVYGDTGDKANDWGVYSEGDIGIYSTYTVYNGGTAFLDIWDDLDVIERMRPIPVSTPDGADVMLVHDPKTLPPELTGAHKGRPDMIAMSKMSDLAIGAVRQLSRESKERDAALYRAMRGVSHTIDRIGSGKLENGRAVVELPADVAEQVDLAKPYHFDLTPMGDCRGLFVSAVSNTGFVVCELQGGRSDIAFTWRLIASAQAKPHAEESFENVNELLDVKSTRKTIEESRRILDDAKKEFAQNPEKFRRSSPTEHEDGPPDKSEGK